MLDMCSGKDASWRIPRECKKETHQKVGKALRCGVGIASLVLRHSKPFVFDILRMKAMLIEATNAFAEKIAEAPTL